MNSVHVLVLLVEDDELTLFPIEEGLRDGGFEPLVARTGQDAIRQLEASADQLSAVITDIRLGGEVDGWQVARHARRLKDDMPIIYMSGNKAGDWANYGVPRSVMLAKPFAQEQLIRALSVLLDRSRTSDLEDQ